MRAVKSIVTFVTFWTLIGLQNIRNSLRLFKAVNIPHEQSVYFGKYLRPFQDTPFPEMTRNADVIIIAAKTAAPSGVVRAYQGEMPMDRTTRARTAIK
jgi:hypothetical protein